MLLIFRILLFMLCLAIGTLFALVTQPLVIAKTSTPPAVDAERLRTHVRALSVDYFPRSFDQLRGLNGAARYITRQLEAMGVTPILQPVPVQESTYQNIVARFGPAGGPLTVVGAHYDSAELDEFVREENRPTPITHTPGADDNASGVAGLIELARLLTQHPPGSAVELVFYTTEEPPHFATEHMGSAHHARQLAASGRPVKQMLALEMIGYFSDQPDSQRYPLPILSVLYPDRGNFIALVGPLGDFALMRQAKAAMSGATDLPVASINAPEQIPGIDFSDHRNYWAEGFPALMVTDTAFYRNPHYHRTGDTFDTLDYRRMAQVVQGVHALLQAP